MKHFWSILFLSILLVSSALACGGPTTPAETPKPAITETPAPTPTPSASDHIEQGITYHEAGNQDSAIAELESALALEPQNAEAHTQLGLIFIDQERFVEAAAEFEAVLAVEPDNAAASGGLCVAYAFEQPEKGESQCQAALEVQPQNADIHNGLGISLALQSRFAEAFYSFEEAIRLDPKHLWAHNNLGYAYLNLDRLDEAITELNLALEINPENADAYYNLGLANAKQGKYDQAIPAYEEALKLEPDLSSVYFDLGLIYRDLGQAEQAIVTFEKFLELRPDSSNRAQIEIMIAELQKPVELAPGNYLEFAETIAADDTDAADFFSFFTSPAEFYGSGEDTVSVTIRPQNNLDVSIAVLDTSAGDGVVVAEVDATGQGGEERLTVTLPETVSEMGVYVIRITAKDSSGDYQASFSGSPAVGFFLRDGWEVNGVLGEQMALLYVISAIGNSNETIVIEATPRQEDNLDLFITAIDTAGNQNLGTLNETGVGEAEGDSFMPDSSVYLFIVGDQGGHPGQIVMKYHK